MPKKRGNRRPREGRPRGKRKSLVARKMTHKEMIALVRSAIKKKEAFGHGRKELKSTEKDWMKREVRDILEYMYERKLFANRMDSRAGTKKFIEKSFRLGFSEERERLLRDHVEDYLHHLFKKHNISPKNKSAKAELIGNFRTTMNLLEERAHEMVLEIRQMDAEKNKAMKGRKAEQKKYYFTNARDAFAHVAGAYALDVVIPEVLEALDRVERRILSH